MSEYNTKNCNSALCWKKALFHVTEIKSIYFNKTIKHSIKVVGFTKAALIEQSGIGVIGFQNMIIH